MDEVRITGVIPATHPCLAGHFPANPIVPGVVLLDEVQAAATAHWGLPAPAQFPSVKFIASVLPEQVFDIVLTRSGLDSYSFRIELGGRCCVQGSVKVAAR